MGNRHSCAHQRWFAARLVEPDGAALAVACCVDRRAPHSIGKSVRPRPCCVAGEQPAIDRASEALVVALHAGILRRRRDRQRAGPRQQPTVHVHDRNAHAVWCVLLQPLLQRFGARVHPAEPARLRDDCVVGVERLHVELRSEQIERRAQLERVTLAGFAPPAFDVRHFVCGGLPRSADLAGADQHRSRCDRADGPGALVAELVVSQHDHAIVFVGGPRFVARRDFVAHRRLCDFDIDVHRPPVHTEAHLRFGRFRARIRCVETGHGTRRLRPLVCEAVEQRAGHEQRSEQIAALRIEFAAQLGNAIEQLRLAGDDAAQHLRSREQRIFLAAPQSRFHLLRVLPACPGQDQCQQAEE